MTHMAKKSKGSSPQPDRHKPHKMVRVPVDVYEQLRKLAEKRDREISRELRRLIVKELEAEGLWPPPASST